MGLVQDTARFIKNAWDAVDEMGGEVPVKKNLANLPEGIASIPQGPAIPTSLAELKQMVNRGREIVTGTEIPDKYDGNDNPIIVAQNLNKSNNSAYGGVSGVICIRKYAEHVPTAFGTTNDYATSGIKNFLDTTYLSNCSDELKSIISSINIPYYDGSAITYIPSQWFLMGDTEVYSNRLSVAEGIAWDYWKEKTGLSAPASASNIGRIIYGQDGNARYIWLRSRYSASYACEIYANGSVMGDTPTTSSSRGVLPACFIGKD